MNINIQIPGAKSLEKKWAAMPTQLKALFAEAFTKAGYVVEGKSKDKTPVLTNRLRSSISTDLSKVVSKNPRVTISPHTNYALYVHEGTRYMEGRPFMANGYKAAKSDIDTIFKNLLKAITKKMS